MMENATDTGRKLRAKERKRYDEGQEQDDEIEGKRTFCVEDKLLTDKFGEDFIKFVEGEEVTLKYVQENGFNTPLLIKDKSGLGMRIPGKEFNVNDVRQFVGSRRLVDVVDVNTQKGIEMTMAQWAKYFENPDRDKLYNVISLEFSRTRLDDYVTSPKLVRQVDWIDNVWPPHLKNTQIESTNAISEMKYPKVQKYCLMSVAGCYTDFHIDFGGTSVWYHILHGKKIFWLIPPTEKNLDLYEAWVLSGKQGDIFLGDRVDHCARVTLYAGYTFFIPTGWIHAVFTPEDSLVFGGNFLHSFNIPQQLRVYNIEDSTRVPQKFRYPFYNEMLWYLLDRYVTVLKGKSRVSVPDDKEKTGDQNGITDKEKMNTAEEKLKTEGKAEGKIGESNHTPRIPRLRSKSSGIETDDKNSVDGKERRNKNDSKNDDACRKEKSENEVGKAEGKIGESNHTPRIPRLRSKSSGIETDDKNSVDGKERRNKNDSKNDDACRKEKSENEVVKKEPLHLTKDEMQGLEAVVDRLEAFPSNKRHVPEGLNDPDGLLEDTKQLLRDHANDDPVLAASGKPIVEWPQPLLRARTKPKAAHTSKPTKPGAVRRRRTRCRKCENCLRGDCSKCSFCKDMKKYGGPGRMKQSCLQRQCLSPVLPHTACCELCGGDDHDERVKDGGIITLMECNVCFKVVHPECLKTEGQPHVGVINEDLSNSWECPQCCSESSDSDKNEPSTSKSRTSPVKSSDKGSSNSTSRKRKGVSPGKTPDSTTKKKVQLKTGRGRGALSSSRFQSRTPGKRPRDKEGNDGRQTMFLKRKRRILGRPSLKGTLGKPKVGKPSTFSRALKIKREKLLAKQKLLKKKIQEMRNNRQKSQGILDMCEVQIKKEAVPEPSTSIHTPINNATNGMRRSPRTVGGRISKPTNFIPAKPIEMERHVVRPRPVSPPPDSLPLDSGDNHMVKRELWMSVFRHLPQQDLCRCMSVCKTWNRWCCDKRLWNRLDLTRIAPITPSAMSGIIRRQPTSLDLGYTNISKKQLSWLVNRLPSLKELGLAGCSWSAVSALCTITCPLLKKLDLRWCEGIRESTIQDLLSPPSDHRPGCLDEQSRLRHLTHLLLAGCDVTDAAMVSVIKHCRQLSKLDLSYCTLLTDKSVDMITSLQSPFRDKLTDLDLTGCHKLTENSIEYLQRCKRLTKINLHSCGGISQAACEKLITSSLYSLCISEKKIISIKSRKRIETII
uniref:LOW QUALITY PROTEIN: lysine-specific demethylase 2A-like n=1 Tax=Saccoglossus kowalevskii TaxID=10224 RepID=A0ABM0MGC3_SACKO|nr:PREDICTED: LOW QUALITY PROTEIN: lysine-specific demethylase 2A-like [Saccoglossus kowalevskii]